MILVLMISLAILAISLRSISTRNDQVLLILCSLLFNLFFMFMEQIYMEHDLLRSFHFSDPSNYHAEIYDLSIDKLLEFISADEYKSNQFYYVINWIYSIAIDNTTTLALALKITNLFIFYSAYIFLIKDQQQNNAIDILLLFHPYLTMTLIRNVRDAYIIFFLAIFIYALKSDNISRLLKYLVYLLSAMFMFTIRPFFVAIMLTLAGSEILSKKTRATRTVTIAVLVMLVAVVFQFNFLDINTKMFSAIFSTISTHEGLDQERDAIVSELLAGNGANTDFWISSIKRILLGIPVFLFTPNPINYTIKYYQENIHGIWGIYTKIDNILIILGSIVNYAIIFPIMLKYFFRTQVASAAHAITAWIMLASYAIFQLGITDTRIKYTFLLFVLMSMRHNCQNVGLSLKDDKKYFLISLILLVGFTLK